MKLRLTSISEAKNSIAVAEVLDPSSIGPKIRATLIPILESAGAFSVGDLLDDPCGMVATARIVKKEK